MEALPEPLQSLAASALAEMQANLRHRLSPQRRQALYAALAQVPALRAAPLWLAVMAAERVLPLFRARCPDDERPAALLAAAIGVLQGQVDGDTAGELEADGYRASKNAWGYEGDELPWPVGLAADAALRALREVRGYRPLTQLEAFLSLGTVALETDQPGAPDRPGPAAGEAANDETLCRLEDSDTASIAAVAAASGDFSLTCDPERLRVFWTWWLQQALPAAVSAALHGRPA